MATSPQAMFSVWLYDVGNAPSFEALFAFDKLFNERWSVDEIEGIVLRCIGEPIGEVGIDEVVKCDRVSVMGRGGRGGSGDGRAVVSTSAKGAPMEDDRRRIWVIVCSMGTSLAQECSRMKSYLYWKMGFLKTYSKGVFLALFL